MFGVEYLLEWLDGVVVRFGGAERDSDGSLGRGLQLGEVVMIFGDVESLAKLISDIVSFLEWLDEVIMTLGGAENCVPGFPFRKLQVDETVVILGGD